LISIRRFSASCGAAVSAKARAWVASRRRSSRALAESETEGPTLARISEELGAPMVDLEDKEAVRAILDGDS
jgi:hypothetical protein